MITAHRCNSISALVQLPLRYEKTCVRQDGNCPCSSIAMVLFAWNYGVIHLELWSYPSKAMMLCAFSITLIK